MSLSLEFCRHQYELPKKPTKKLIFTLLAAALFPPVALAATPTDVAAPIRQFIDAFNSGDTKAAFATYASDTISVVDEFAPHLWVGPHAPQNWAADYDKHAAATGVTDGKVTYGNPTRIEVEGPLAYVVMPTVYL